MSAGWWSAITQLFLGNSFSLVMTKTVVKPRRAGPKRTDKTHLYTRPKNCRRPRLWPVIVARAQTRRPHTAKVARRVYHKSGYNWYILEIVLRSLTYEYTMCLIHMLDKWIGMYAYFEDTGGDKLKLNAVRVNPV